MKIRRAGLGVVAAVGVGCLAMASSQAAQAQVKLEYKFPEGKKLTYKTTTKMHQVLTINGMEIPTDVEQTVVVVADVGKRRGRFDPADRGEGRIAPRGVGAPRRHQCDLRLEASPTPRSRTRSSPSWATCSSWPARPPTRSCSMARTRSRRSRGPRSCWRRPTSSTRRREALIRGQLESDKLKTEFEQAHRNLPDVLARPGEPWERTETLEVGGGQTLSFRKKYEYAGTEKKGDKTLDKITSKVIEVKYTRIPTPSRRSR